MTTTEIEALNTLAQQVHQANIRWWQDIHTGEPIERNRLELLCLVHSELSESWDACGPDDKLSHRYGCEVELADAKIRLLDYAGGYGYTLDCGYVPEIELCIADIHSAVSAIAEYERRGERSLASICLSNAIAAIDLYAAQCKLDLPGALTEKLEYNRTRADHTHEERRKDGGKKA